MDVNDTHTLTDSSDQGAPGMPRCVLPLPSIFLIQMPTFPRPNVFSHLLNQDHTLPLHLEWEFPWSTTLSTVCLVRRAVLSVSCVHLVTHYGKTTIRLSSNAFSSHWPSEQIFDQTFFKHFILVEETWKNMSGVFLMSVEHWFHNVPAMFFHLYFSKSTFQEHSNVNFQCW